MKEKFTLSVHDWLTITRPAAWKPWAQNAQRYLIGSAVGLLFARFAVPLFGDERVTDLLTAASVAIAGAGLWIALRPTAEEARSIALEAEQHGDSHSDADAQKALQAYEKAVRWTANPAKRKLVKTKLSQVRSKVVAQLGAGAVLADGDATATKIVVERTVLERVGPYELLSKIGHTDQGDVFEAYDTKRRRDVIVTKLPSTLITDKAVVLRLTQDFKALALLSHAAILKTYESFQDRNDFYVATELAPGEDLQTKIARDGRFSPRTAVPIGRRIAEGLAAAHAQGIAHADINPLHVLLGNDGEPKITGFGFAHSHARQLPGGGVVTGSPAYTSPEQAQGKPADARSDVYSFGITLYHLLSGRPPFEGDASEVLAQHVTDRVPALPDVPADLDAVLHKCTHPDPARRYQDGAALVTAFRRLQGEIA